MSTAISPHSVEIISFAITLYRRNTAPFCFLLPKYTKQTSIEDGFGAFTQWLIFHHFLCQMASLSATST